MKNKIMKVAFIAIAIFVTMEISGIANYAITQVCGKSHPFGEFMVSYSIFLLQALCLIGLMGLIIGGCLWAFKKIYTKLFN
jgi:hypothetical protein